MIEFFKGLSFSHRNMPLELREKLALNEDETRQLLRYFNEFSDVEDVLILSTCNRIEFYYSHLNDRTEEILKIIGIFKGNQNLKDLKDFAYVFKTHKEAVEHLFKVSMGLKSQVVGDIQVINQVKKAYQFSADENMAGALLHRLMHTIFLTNKRVAQETEFKDGAASISYATVDLVKRKTKHLENPKILKVGLGEIGVDVVDNLKKWYPSVTLVNRTVEKSEAIAVKNGYKTAPYEYLASEIEKADVIISSVSTGDSIITPQNFSGNSSKKILVDLSVPRSISPVVGELQHIGLYNIDDLKQTTYKSLEKRKSSIPQVHKIVEESINDLYDWSKETEIYPAINKIKESLEQLRKEELERYMKELDPEKLALVEKITKGLIQKIIKYPVLQLKAACKRDEAGSLAEILTSLFDLERQKIK